MRHRGVRSILLGAVEERGPTVLSSTVGTKKPKPIETGGTKESGDRREHRGVAPEGALVAPRNQVFQATRTRE